MALFNRKKGDAPASDAPAAATPPADNGAFDFDAISRDLDAQGGASSFDSLLAGPATTSTGTNASSTRTADSAFDFPENDPLGLGEPPANPPGLTTTKGTGVPGMVTPGATSPDAVINAPLAPSPTPASGVAPSQTAPDVTPPIVPPTGRATRLKGKKSLPIVPLLGALGMLAVAGGGAMFLLNSNKEATDSTPPASVPPRVARNPSPATPATTPAAPVAGLRSASPGIAPAVAPAKPATGAPSPGTSNVAVSVGQNPVAPVRPTTAPVRPSTSPVRPATAPASTVRGPSATAGLDPALASKLKALWQVGKEAKARKDFAGARKAWQEALRLRPEHPGFQDSINKLPR